ncbi:CatB-related O-acetyltransferase [Caulobacter segnis]|uniref:CatB-related O-acetyltransferase n=1 Tax=Caulobacter segnis TaxID=88688 RepID=UPI001CC1415F|nr:CatB-related O-acetyltransferase [Caulobacter segnis]UAL08906.1 CatB-related O-acetyltransferase [Caulobacter segnis]
MKRRIFRLLRVFESEFQSLRLRKFFKKWFDVEVGLYSYGCFDPKRMPRGMRIGRYCSFATSSYFFPRNHGVSYIGLTPYFYNSALGILSHDNIQNVSFVVEDDVWVGHNVTVTSKAHTLGRGSVIAANSVVTAPVPRYSIVAGNPARVIKYRFSPDVIDKIESTRWWDGNIDDIRNMITERPELCFHPETYFDKED